MCRLYVLLSAFCFLLYGKTSKYAKLPKHVKKPKQQVYVESNMHHEIISNQSQPRIPFYKFYLSIPPIGSAILASMVVNGMAFKPFEVHYSQSDYCQDVAQRALDRQHAFPLAPSNNACTSINFNSEWWSEVLAEPMLGFVITASVTWVFFAASRYVLQASDSYKGSWVANKIATAINFTITVADSVLPKADNVHDTLNFVVLNGAISAAYGLVGAGCLGRIHDIKGVTSVASVQAVGGAVLPTIGVGLLWGYRAVKHCISMTKNESEELDPPLLDRPFQVGTSRYIF
jgi:hypothetical protein